jgi:PilZ domain
MPELMRSIAARLHRFIGNRRRAPRHKMRLPLSLSLLDVRSKGDGSEQKPALEGYTRDVSETGLALILPAIRIGEHYLTGEGRPLRIMLELPTGPIQMDVLPVRYERLDESETEKGYLVGVSITDMSDTDRATFVEYMRKLTKG